MTLSKQTVERSFAFQSLNKCQSYRQKQSCTFFIAQVVEQLGCFNRCKLIYTLERSGHCSTETALFVRSTQLWYSFSPFDQIIQQWQCKSIINIHHEIYKQRTLHNSVTTSTLKYFFAIITNEQTGGNTSVTGKKRLKVHKREKTNNKRPEDYTSQFALSHVQWWWRW